MLCRTAPWGLPHISPFEFGRARRQMRRPRCQNPNTRVAASRTTPSRGLGLVSCEYQKALVIQSIFGMGLAEYVQADDRSRTSKMPRCRRLRAT
jgi:hypothetical protein